MKKIFKFLVVILLTLPLVGCINNNSMEDITIYTTSYPIEYITSRLYKEYSTIKSIYPNGVDINEYKLTNNLINEYSNNDIFIFNGLSKEKEYVAPMRLKNKDLKIIDVTSDISYDYANEELWLDPAKLLGLANNIHKGFHEYITATYLTDKIDENYELLKEDLTNLEAQYREELKATKNTTIVVSNDMFMFLEKYGLTVISLDTNNKEYDKNLLETKKLINNGYLKYIFVPDIGTIDDSINNLSIEKIQLHTLSNLTDAQRDNYDYLSLMNENLETIKQQLNA